MRRLKTASRRLITSSCLEKLRDPSIRYMKVARPRLWAFVLAYYFPLALASRLDVSDNTFCKVAGILLINGIRNLSSTDKELEIQSLESGIHGMESRTMTVLENLTRDNKYNHL